MTARSYYMHVPRERKPEPIGRPQHRYAVSCWDTVHAYAFNRPPDAVVCVLAPDPESAQDAVRSRKAGFDCYEVRLATAHDEENGMTLSEFRNRYNTP